jgi:hypothetical protein
MLGPAPFFLRPDRIWMYLVYVGALTAVQVLICYLEGAPSRWRWGRLTIVGVGIRPGCAVAIVAAAATVYVVAYLASPWAPHTGALGLGPSDYARISTLMYMLTGVPVALVAAGVAGAASRETCVYIWNARTCWGPGEVENRS